MNNQMARTLTLAALSVGLLSPAYGQYVERIIQVTTPFEFTVNDRSFPAGPYSIVCLARNRLDLRDARSRVSFERRAEITRRMTALRRMLSGLDELFGSSIRDDELFSRADRGASSRRKG